LSSNRFATPQKIFKKIIATAQTRKAPFSIFTSKVLCTVFAGIENQCAPAPTFAVAVGFV
jgi:hypothetical protein